MYELARRSRGSFPQCGCEVSRLHGKTMKRKNEKVQSRKELVAMVRGAPHGRNGHHEELKAPALFTKSAHEVQESAPAKLPAPSPGSARAATESAAPAGRPRHPARVAPGRGCGDPDHHRGHPAREEGAAREEGGEAVHRRQGLALHRLAAVPVQPRSPFMPEPEAQSGEVPRGEGVSPAAMYARVSTDSQDATNQFPGCRQLAAARRLEVVEVYVDDGI
jgi:hypothetical protein